MSTALEFPLPPSLPVPQAGRLFWGLGRDAAYGAAERGQIPSVRIGRSVRVPTHAALKQLGWTDDLIARALGLETASDSTNDEPCTGSPSASVHVLAQKTGGLQHAP